MSTSTIPWRKRSIDSDSPIENKRPRGSGPIYYHFKLESESSERSDANDTESVYSIQDQETDYVKDTSDTDSDSTVIDVEIEYELASNSEEGGGLHSSSEDEILDFAVATVAATVCDSSLEAFITDAEDSDNSLEDDSTVGLIDYWTCIQCKSQNDNPQFRLCDKCFQDRKMQYPPRPRRYKKAKRSNEKALSPVKLEALQSCLSGLSQDSGIGSSQEFGSLNLDQIQVPEQEKPSTSVNGSRKRSCSESSLSDEYDAASRPSKKAKVTGNGKDGAVQARTSDKKDEVVSKPVTDMNMCIMCNSRVKDGAFLHGRIAHMCSCYECAKRTWKSSKRCPICNRKISNIVKVFSA